MQVGEGIEALIKTTASGCDSSLSGAAPSGPIQPYFKSTATSNGKLSIDQLASMQASIQQSLQNNKGIGLKGDAAIRSSSIEYDPAASNEYASMNADMA